MQKNAYSQKCKKKKLNYSARIGVFNETLYKAELS